MGHTVTFSRINSPIQKKINVNTSRSANAIQPALEMRRSTTGRAEAPQFGQRYDAAG